MTTETITIPPRHTEFYRVETINRSATKIVVDGSVSRLVFNGVDFSNVGEIVAQNAEQVFFANKCVAIPAKITAQKAVTFEDYSGAFPQLSEIKAESFTFRRCAWTAEEAVEIDCAKANYAFIGNSGLNKVKIIDGKKSSSLKTVIFRNMTLASVVSEYQGAYLNLFFDAVKIDSIQASRLRAFKMNRCRPTSKFFTKINFNYVKNIDISDSVIGLFDIPHGVRTFEALSNRLHGGNNNTLSFASIDWLVFSHNTFPDREGLSLKIDGAKRVEINNTNVSTIQLLATKSCVVRETPLLKTIEFSKCRGMSLSISGAPRLETLSHQDEGGETSYISCELFNTPRLVDLSSFVPTSLTLNLNVGAVKSLGSKHFIQLGKEWFYIMRGNYSSSYRAVKLQPSNCPNDLLYKGRLRRKFVLKLDGIGKKEAPVSKTRQPSMQVVVDRVRGNAYNDPFDGLSSAVPNHSWLLPPATPSPAYGPIERRIMNNYFATVANQRNTES
jgi:hypothetical protein